MPSDAAPRAGRSRLSLVRLWIVVSALWSLATPFGLGRSDALRLGWDAVLRDGATWVALLLPPAFLAAILAAIDWALMQHGRIAPSARKSVP